MDLTIVIVSFNTKKQLKKCLSSITEESQKIRKEIVVVDNASDEGSAEEVRKFIKFIKSKNKDSKIKLSLIENKENLGFAKAVNQGLRQFEGGVVLLLNSDTQVKPGALEKLLEFEKKVRPAIIGLKMLNPDGSVQGSVFNLPTAKRAVEEFWLGRKGSFSKFTPNSGMPMVVEAVSGGAMAISREVVDKIGLLDERYFMYFEDLDYCRRARKAGFKIFYFPQAQVIHEHGASGRNLAEKDDQWKRLIPSSKIYYGRLRHYLIFFITLIGQRLKMKK
ncbi:MAG: N-acetylglucosaminyl-diphospho-decaprenol L-rhamnosyltransferase [Microgenomates group bacterium ADurb.Bin219]|nr:MAG: N-acetylglucosaminyl-diphospho-decaprenol L-rhamnosyltransferase [Microgenomates group bacterium ADurb.Bin219]